MSHARGTSAESARQRANPARRVNRSKHPQDQPLRRPVSHVGRGHSPRRLANPCGIIIEDMPEVLPARS
jgi:hypothetical protein